LGKNPLENQGCHKGIELHPNVTLWTDVNHRTPVRLMLLSYSQLPEQPELSFDTLKQLPSQWQTEVVKLLTRGPLKCLLTCLDEKAFRFQVIEPKVKELAAEPLRHSSKEGSFGVELTRRPELRKVER